MSPQIGGFLLALLVCQAAAEVNVLGCFKDFKPAVTLELSWDNSNFKCQEECNFRGYSVAATTGCNKCMCSYNYPAKQQHSDDDKCAYMCGDACMDQPGMDLQSSCGGPGSYIVSGVGPLNAHREVLRWMIRGWDEKGSLRDHIIKSAQRYNGPPRPPPLDEEWVIVQNLGTRQCLQCGKTGCTHNGLAGGSCRRSTQSEHFVFSSMVGEEGNTVSTLANDFYQIRSRNQDKCLTHFGPSYVSIDGRKCQGSPGQLWTVYAKQTGSTKGVMIKNVKYNKCLWMSKGTTKMGIKNCDAATADMIFNVFRYDKYTDMNNPDISITMQPPQTQTAEECWAKGKDKSIKVDTLECKPAPENKVIMNNMDMTMLESVDGGPKNPELVGFYSCENRGNQPMDCSRKYTTSFTKSWSFSSSTSVRSLRKIHGTFSIKFTVGVSFAKLETGYTLQHIAENENTFTSSSEKSESETVKQEYQASAIAPPGKKVTIEMWRDRRDYTYAWESRLRALGAIEVKFDNGYVYRNSASALYSGDHAQLFGSYVFPDVDTITSKVKEEDL